MSLACAPLLKLLECPFDQWKQRYAASSFRKGDLLILSARIRRDKLCDALQELDRNSQGPLYCSGSSIKGCSLDGQRFEVRLTS